MSYKIIIKKGNLLEETDATFIINASNTTLTLGSGVSMAFKRHCGIELQEEMVKALQIKGRLNKGDVVRTSSCASNFKYSLHCAVMDYNQGVKDKNPTLQTIEDILNNIENEIKNYHLHFREKIKIVLPLLGCGVGGLDKIEVIKLYKKHFSKKLEIECEVVLYGYNDEDFESLQSIFSPQFIPLDVPQML